MSDDDYLYLECRVCCYGTNSERAADRHHDRMLIEDPDGPAHNCYQAS